MTGREDLKSPDVMISWCIYSMDISDNTVTVNAGAKGRLPANTSQWHIDYFEVAWETAEKRER